MRRWTASYRIDWSPVISFERRRAALLDWVEENLKPVAFRDVEGEIGVSLERGVRIRIDRTGAFLENRSAATDGVASLWPMLEGLCKVMEPRDLTLGSGSIAWSCDIGDGDYARSTRSLAERVTGLSTLSSGTYATDVAALVDFEGPGYDIQCEYGVVSPLELGERLSDLSVGKIKARPGAVLKGHAFNGLPELSLFIDTVLFNKSRDTLTGPEEIITAIERVNAATEEVAAAVANSVVEKENVK